MKKSKETDPEFLNPIDPDKVAENPGLLPYAHTVGSAVIRPEDKGKSKARALVAMEQQTERQLQQIYGQIQTLAEQARTIQERVEVSQLIYDAEMGFEPLVGHRYHLYRKKNGTHTLSMVGPEEWGNSSPYEEHVSSVELLADHTWQILERDA